MVGLVLRLAMLGGAVLVMWNVAETFLRALRAPRQTMALDSECRNAAAARDLAEMATRKIVIIKAEIASTGDSELWTACEAFTDAAERLAAAVVMEPVGYRRARRHLSQILFGAKSATKRYVALQQVAPDEDGRARFIQLYRDLETAFKQAIVDYAESSKAELEIEEAVLRELISRVSRSKDD